MVRSREGVLLRKVNIVNWESEAAQQAGREFGLKGIPHVRVFNRDGELIEALDGPDASDVEAAVHRAEE